MKFRLTINGKMLLYILGVTALIYAGSLGYIGVRLYNVSTNSATETSIAIASEYSSMALQSLSQYEQAAEVLANVFTNINAIPEEKRRTYALDAMEKLMQSNSDFLSIWAIWEPYTIDQLDSVNIFAPGSTYIGSFSPGLFRENNEIKLEKDTDTVLFQGQYYVNVKACECPMLLEPYYYSYSGSDSDSILQTNLVLPIIIDGVFKGVVGIDIPLAYFQKLYDEVKPLGTGQVYILSNSGEVVYSPDMNYIGKSIVDIAPDAEARYNLNENIAGGSSFSFYGENRIFNADAFMSFQPIVIGGSTTPWSFCVAIPKKTIYSQSTKSLFNIVILGIIGLLILSVIFGAYAKSLTKPLLKVTSAIQQLAEGNIDLSKKVKYRIPDEIGLLVSAVNQLFDGLNSAAKFAGEIGKGNLNAEYKLLSPYDELGNSLLEMQKSLLIARDEEDQKKKLDDQRNWVTHGLAQFGEVIRKDNDDMVKFSTNVVTELAKYMNVAQAAIFISEKNEYSEVKEEYVLKAAMAYGKLVMLEKRVEQGHELLGRAVDENKVINLIDLPENYVEISPGLKSKKRPNNLLISPLIVNDIAFGVLELLSYDPFLDHHIEFIEKLSENVASVISSVNTNIQTARLLEQSQHQADELAQHEEEMRQNLEEMLATQEEASKRESDLASFIKTVQSAFMTAELDLSGRVLFMSKSMMANYGVTLDNVRGKYFDAFIAQNEDLRDKFSKFWEDLVHNGKGKRKHTIVKRNKTIVLFEEYLVIEQEGLLPKVLLVAIDRSDQEELRKKLQKELNS